MDDGDAQCIICTLVLNDVEGVTEWKSFTSFRFFLSLASFFLLARARKRTF